MVDLELAVTALAPVRCMARTGWVRGRGSTRGGGLGGVPGGCYTGYLPSRLIGIARAQPMALQLYLRPPGTPGPYQAPPHTWLLALTDLASGRRKGEIPS